MKKLISILLSLALLSSVLAGCGNTATQKEKNTDPNTASETQTEAVPESKPDNEERALVRLGGLKGSTSIGMVKLLADNEEGLTSNTYEFTLAGSADELTPALVKGELDILAAPVNLGAILYRNTEGGVKMAAVNTLGVLYVVEKGGETVTDWQSLKGKTILATGKGSTPEYALTYLLTQNGLTVGEDVTVEWKNEPSEVISLMAAADTAVAMLPQPYVTVAQMQLEGLRVALDLTASWKELDNGTSFITAGLIIRTAFAEEHPEAVKAFLEEYAASTAYVNENVAEAAALVEKYDIVKAAVAEKAIPFCNIVCITGEEMKTMTQGYLKVLYDANPKVVGGNLPADDFYWTDGK